MGQKPKILVVDDEAEVRHILRDALTQAGHRVVRAASGEETLRLIGAESFDVILLDLKMPGMNGLEVLKALKGGGVEVEVVIMTGYGDVESAVEAMKLGAYDYLQKPFIIAELDQVLKRAV